MNVAPFHKAEHLARVATHVQRLAVELTRERVQRSHDIGYRTIADIMTALNPFTGEFYRETLHVSRYTREMFCLMEGRHVHPSTLYPGGVGTVATIQLL